MAILQPRGMSNMHWLYPPQTHSGLCHGVIQELWLKHSCSALIFHVLSTPQCLCCVCWQTIRDCNGKLTPDEVMQALVQAGGCVGWRVCAGLLICLSACLPVCH